MRRTDFIFKYRIRNWSEYNEALISRGSLTFWVDEQAVSAWRRRGSSQGRGRPQIYSDTAIECALVVRRSSTSACVRRKASSSPSSG